MWNWAKRIWSRKTRDEDLEREVNAHLELEAEEQREAGLAPEEARYAARRAFGNVMSIKEATREMWGWTSLERFAQDLRYATRTLAKSPGFSLVAVVSLALGIGANTAIFSLVDGLWFRPMPLAGSGELTRLFSVTSQDTHGLFSFPEYLELQKQAPAFRSLVACGRRGARIPNPDGTFDLLLINVVSTNFFQALGVHAAVGRTFAPGEEPALLQQPVVLLGYSFWQRRFGGDPAIVGKQIPLDRGDGTALVTVLGVLPREFREIEPALSRDLWFPPQTWVRLSGRGDLEERNFRWFELLGRLAPGASVASARAQAQTIAQRLAAAWPSTNAGRSANVVSDLRHRLAEAGTNGLVLLAVVLSVVLLCSVNVANLLLARSAARSREMAVRLALGAGRLRLVAQLMTENAMLGLAGMAAGMVIGVWLIGILPALLPVEPRSELIFVFDSRVLLFSLAVSLATIAFFGLTPSWRASSQNLTPALKGETSLSIASRRGFHLRHWLVVAQVSVSLTLLAVTGGLVESFVNTRVGDLGLSRKPLLTVFLSWSQDQAQVLFRESLARLAALPGVQEVAYATRAPLSLSEGGMTQRVSFPGRTEWRGQPPVEIKYNSISSNYLRVMGTPVLRGRGFDELDESSGPRVALISERMAQRYWPGEDPLGKTIRLEGAQGPECRIVGIVKDVPINEVGEPAEPYLYLPYWRSFTESFTFVIETRGDAAALAQPARRTLIGVDRRLDPFMMNTEEELIKLQAGRFQVTAELVAVLGFLGLLLTAVGLYGVVSYGVTRRTREIGIRMALGSDRARTLKLVLSEVLLLGLMGMAAGLPLALIATRLFSALLFGVGPWDPPTFLAAGALLAAVLVAAGLAPARRATRIDPLRALRYE